MSGEAEYAIDSGWLVEVVNEHTCGAGPGGHFGAHEPGCGLIPLGPVEELLEDAAIGARLKMLFAGGRDTPCRTTTRPDGVECVEVPMEDLRAAFEAGADQ